MFSLVKIKVKNNHFEVSEGFTLCVYCEEYQGQWAETTGK